MVLGSVVKAQLPIVIGQGPPVDRAHDVESADASQPFAEIGVHVLGEPPASTRWRSASRRASIAKKVRAAIASIAITAAIVTAVTRRMRLAASR
jgi:hypothetical protein